MSRITDDAGRIRTIAIDHPDNYLLLFDEDLTKVSFEEVVESKLEMIAELPEHATSVLADPVYCFGQSIVTGALPGGVGVISGIEDLYYTPATSPVGFDTELRLKDGWTPAKLAALGADAAKLVVFHREDGDAADVQRQHEVVAQAAASATRSACRSSSSRCGSRSRASRWTTPRCGSVAGAASSPRPAASTTSAPTS